MSDKTIEDSPPDDREDSEEAADDAEPRDEEEGTDQEPDDKEPDDEGPRDEEPDDEEPSGDDRDEERDEDERNDEPRRDEPRRDEASGDGASPLTALQVLRQAKDQFAEFTGRRAESVIGMDRTDHGWRATFEVVELERIPPTTSVLGSYEVELDGDGNLLNYERVRRFYRNQTDES